MPTFIDMFAGDINPTCEVTHRLRYIRQLGLSTEFLTKDISDPDYIEELYAKLEEAFGKVTVDVIIGGPPCQSFSLAGERMHTVITKRFLRTTVM